MIHKADGFVLSISVRKARMDATELTRERDSLGTTQRKRGTKPNDATLLPPIYDLAGRKGIKLGDFVP